MLSLCYVIPRVVPVHRPDDLFAASREAGIPDAEVMIGMVSRVADRVLCVVAEETAKVRMQPRVKPPKADPRKVSEDDTSMIRAGKPGSAERIAAYAEWYAANPETSPFMGE